MIESTHADVVVIGAGPAGIAAACEAAERGRSVVVLDENPAAGGQVWRRPAGADRLPRRARRWIDRFRRSGAKLLTGVTAFDMRGMTVMGERAEITHCVSGGRIVLATGARERFLPFPGWTLPGVVGAGAAQAMAKSGARFDGMRVIVAGTGPLLLPAAAAVARAGGEVTMIAEQAALGRLIRFLSRHPSTLPQAAALRSRTRRARYCTATWIRTASAEGSRLTVEIERRGRRSTVACDLLCCSFGLVANLEIARLIGCEIREGAVVAGGECKSSVEGVYAAGELLGIAGLEHALVTGSIAGAAACGDERAGLRWEPVMARMRRYAESLGAAFAIRDELKRLPEEGTVICRCEDARLGQIDPLWDARQAKLYTRAGMGACQGRVCSAALESLYGWEADTVRPPVKPVPLRCLVPWG